MLLEIKKPLNSLNLNTKIIFIIKHLSRSHINTVITKFFEIITFSFDIIMHIQVIFHFFIFISYQTDCIRCI